MSIQDFATWHSRNGVEVPLTMGLYLRQKASDNNTDILWFQFVFWLSSERQMPRGQRRRVVCWCKVDWYIISFRVGSHRQLHGLAASVLMTFALVSKHDMIDAGPLEQPYIPSQIDNQGLIPQRFFGLVIQSYEMRITGNFYS